MALVQPKRKLVVLDEGAISTMALSAAVAKEFSFLGPVAKLIRSPRGRGCSTCGRAAAERSKLFQQAKQAIAGLASDRKRRLKELMNAEQLRVIYIKSNGKPENLTF